MLKLLSIFKDQHQLPITTYDLRSLQSIEGYVLGVDFEDLLVFEVHLGNGF